MWTIKKYLINKWCALLAAVLTLMGFQACGNSRKIVVDDNNTITEIPDTTQQYKPPRKPANDEMICLYGVPPSQFQQKNIEK